MTAQGADWGVGVGGLIFSLPSQPQIPHLKNKDNATCCLSLLQEVMLAWHSQSWSVLHTTYSSSAEGRAWKSGVTASSHQDAAWGQAQGAQEKTAQTCPCRGQGCRGGTHFRYDTFLRLRCSCFPSDVNNFQDLNVFQIASLLKRP